MSGRDLQPVPDWDKLLTEEEKEFVRKHITPGSTSVPINCFPPQGAKNVVKIIMQEFGEDLAKAGGSCGEGKEKEKARCRNCRCRN